jgi:ankyrin repeat protein
MNLLLDRGANIHALNPSDLQAIDFAIWGDRPTVNDDVARLLVFRGATYDLTIASALGDLAGVRQMLDDNPVRISEARPNGWRPLSAAVVGHDDIVRLLLERGANPRWEEPDAPRGTSVHSASRMGNLAMVKLLL